MSETKKLLIGFAVVGVLCVCIAGIFFLGMRSFGRRIENMVEGDPTSVAGVQDRIADFEIPPGYEPMAMSVLGNNILYLTPEDPDTGLMIMFMQFSGYGGTDARQMEDQLKRAAEQQTGQSGYSMNVVDTFEDEIRGQTVTVTVSETNVEGFVLRQWMTTFEGREGPVVLMIQGPADSWDDQLVEDFINSIK